MNTISDTLDPNDYVVSPHVAILDEFRMTGGDGAFVADITPGFIDKLIAHMNEREAQTGDLCPLVIGHTQDGLPETDQPPLVGYARNWHKGVLGTTGRQCAFFDAWVLKTQVDLARKFPRRSAEVWASRYEIDPISLLGATTPARDLGLLKLSREGSFTYTAPGDMVMPDDKKPEDKKPEPKADPKESGAAKGLEGKLDSLLQMMGQVLEAMGGAGQAGAAPAPGATPGGDAQMGDEEYEKLLQELMAGGGEPGAGAPGAPEPKDSRAGEKPVQNMGGYDDGAKAKLSRTEQELADVKAEVARMKVKDTLVRLSREGRAVDPDDTALIEDLVAMEPTMRQRQLDRIAKTPAAPGSNPVQLSRVLDGALANGTQGKRMDGPTMQRLSRKAVETKKTFEQVAADEGYDLN